MAMHAIAARCLAMHRIAVPARTVPRAVQIARTNFGKKVTRPSHTFRAQRAYGGRRFAVNVQAAVKTGDSMTGMPAYSQKVRASDGNSYALSDYQEEKPVVLFFYPKAGTPGCTKEAQKFRDEYSKFEELGAAVFGISGDTVDEQKNFVDAQNLPYPLLADAGNALRKAFGVKADLFGALPGRQTFVIGKDGTCLLSFNDQLGAEKHAAEALKALQNVE